jgi:hypothetical protein
MVELVGHAARSALCNTWIHLRERAIGTKTDADKAIGTVQDTHVPEHQDKD